MAIAQHQWFETASSKKRFPFTLSIESLANLPLSKAEGVLG